ncbi:MAG: Crp/Fnr family transcriptional regulator [Bacteroidales bacterium]|nr:Crp/Fnr family transcriptional regulator [Bacteroidales bacterium]
MGEIINGNCLVCSRRADVFRALNENEIAQIDCHRVTIRFKPGEILFKQGTPCHNLVCVTSGLVKLFVEHNNSSNLIIGLAKPVEYIFVPGIYIDQRHHFTAEACEETTACIIDLPVMNELMRTNPDFSLEVIKKISQQSINLYDRLSGQTHKHVYGRVAETLLYLSNSIYKQNPFKLTLSRQDLADMTGMTKESFIRVLKKFKEDEIVTSEGNHLEIINFPMLEKISVNG